MADKNGWTPDCFVAFSLWKELSSAVHTSMEEAKGRIYTRCPYLTGVVWQASGEESAMRYRQEQVN
jgi:hypothetical protein